MNPSELEIERLAASTFLSKLTALNHIMKH